MFYLFVSLIRCLSLKIMPKKDDLRAAINQEVTRYLQNWPIFSITENQGNQNKRLKDYMLIQCIEIINDRFSRHTNCKKFYKSFTVLIWQSRTISMHGLISQILWRFKTCLIIKTLSAWQLCDQKSIKLPVISIRPRHRNRRGKGV